MKKLIALLIISLLLTGCWDEDQLKKMLFADVIGLDYEGDSKQLKVSFVISSLKNVSQGGGTSENLYISSNGDNIYDAVSKSNRIMPGILTVLETRLFLISTRFAKDQPLNYLNITSQFTASPLYGYLAVYDGDISKLLAKKKVKDDQTPAEFLVGLLDDEKKRGNIPSSKLVQYILGGAEFINDFAVNRFEPFENGARLAGTALFREGTYTGVNLNDEDTRLAVLMYDTVGKNQLIHGETNGKKYTALVNKANRQIHVNSKDNSLYDIDVVLKLDVKLISDGIEFKKKTNDILTELEKEISTDLTAKASNVITTLQKANCDYLQLGHEIAAYHPKLFKDKIWWREQYPNVRINASVTVKILNTGILE